MLRGEEDSDVEVPVVDRSHPNALLDVGGGLPLPTMLYSEACKLGRPRRSGREILASPSHSVRPDKDSVARKLFEAVEQRNRMNG
jgi:hypothetical protein